MGGVYSRLDAQREILAHGHRGFEALLALLAHQLSPQMRWPGGGEEDTDAAFSNLRFRCSVSYFPPSSGATSESINRAHFPASAVMYSSQEMVFGAGAVRDCRRTGWTQDRRGFSGPRSSAVA